jgi:hypothetical protein
VGVSSTLVLLPHGNEIRDGHPPFTVAMQSLLPHGLSADNQR